MSVGSKRYSHNFFDSVGKGLEVFDTVTRTNRDQGAVQTIGVGGLGSYPY